MENKQCIKCPICGKDEFVPFENPISDQYARLSGKAYICPHCGYVLWMCEGYPEFYRDRMDHIKEIDKEIQKNETTRKEFESKTQDVSKNIKQLAELKKQLKQRLEWGDGGKIIQSLKEQIQEQERIIASGKNPEVIGAIETLNSLDRKLSEKKEGLLKPITTLKLYN